MTETAEPTTRRFTIAEYLEREEAATEKHEFHDGEILAMSGNSFAHSQIAVNLSSELRNRLRGTPCQPLESNMRTRIAQRNRYVYPDVTIVCGTPEFDPHSPRPVNLLNPRVVFEILSESTRAYDRGEKFDAYRTVRSLEEYVLIEQSHPQVQTFFRQADGSWRMDSYDTMDAVAILRSLSIELPLAEIYLNVTFPPPPSPQI